jgi:histidine ammonia-lyase
MRGFFYNKSPLIFSVTYSVYMDSSAFPLQLTPNNLSKLVDSASSISIQNDYKKKLRENHRFLQHRLDQGDEIYGVNTGFGPLVHNQVSNEDILTLQENLLQQLGCNVGPSLTYRESRAVLLVRLNAISRGFSGISEELAEHIVNFYNSGLAPHLQEWGSVGASGDLVPLSRLARVFLGKDSVINKDKTVQPNSQKLLDEYDLPPYQLKPKEGLALVNGTSFSAALTALSVHQLNYLFSKIWLPLIATSFHLFDDSIQHLSERIYDLKAHDSAKTVAKELRGWMAPLRPEDSFGTPQPPYSSRSAVLWMGAVLERLQQSEKLTTEELNSVDDNPLFFSDDQKILHAANFQGTYIAMAADEAHTASVNAANLIERIINRLTNVHISEGFPPFLAPEPVGLHSGLQGLQLLTTSLLAKLRGKNPVQGTQTFPTNADNQDVVSMSANAALNLRESTQILTTISAAFLLNLARAQQIKPCSFGDQLSHFWADFEYETSLNFSELSYSEELEKLVQKLTRK